MYYSQRYPKSKASESDKYGSFVIPDHSSFFVVVYKNNISIYQSRDEMLRHAQDNLLIEYVLPVPEDDYLKGGVRNMGKFKAGYCMKVFAKVPTEFNSEDLKQESWVFCFNDNNKKSQFLKSVARMKMIDQRSKDQVVTAASNTEVAEEEKTKDTTTAKKESSKDGKMIMIQDWSECTLKCGGGKQYQQWMCIPPQNGGLPCKGELIREKACNTEACPEVKASDDPNKIDDKQPFIKPTIKIARFSQRFNRYSKCIIRETDIFKMDKENNKYPARLVMNNQTLTIYGDDTYENKEYSFEIENTEFTLEGQDFCCFLLTDKIRQQKFCGFDTACGDPDENPFVRGLYRDFRDMKFTCKKGRMTHIISDADQEEIKKSKAKTMEMRNFEVETKKMEKANNEIEIETDDKVFQKIKDTQATGLKVLEKEIFIEGLIKKDENKKQQEQETLILEQMDTEKQKKKKIERQIYEKELEQEFQMDEMKAEKDIKEAKQEIQQQVEINRDKLKAAIEKIRQMGKQSRSSLKGKLKNLKTKLTQKILAANRVGSKLKCIEGLSDPNIKDEYCNNAYPDDYFENEYCRNLDNYCYSCCDVEFGLLKPAERDDCFETCDKERDKLEKENAEKEAKESAKANQWQWKASKKAQ